MKFAPKSKEELKRMNLLAPGWYDFEVMAAVDKTSKAGNEMIEAKLRVFRPNGGEAHIFDYLMEAMPDKLYDFCESVGLVDKYQAGTLSADDCVGRAAKVKIAVDDKNDDYPAKNVAKGYATAESIRNKPEAKVTEPDDDEIPPF